MNGDICGHIKEAKKKKHKKCSSSATSLDHHKPKLKKGCSAGLNINMMKLCDDEGHDDCDSGKEAAHDECHSAVEEAHKDCDSAKETSPFNSCPSCESPEEDKACGESHEEISQSSKRRKEATKIIINKM